MQPHLELKYGWVFVTTATTVPLPATLDFVHSHFFCHYLVALQVAIVKIKGPRGWPVDLPDPHEHMGCTSIGKWRKWMTQWVIWRDLRLNDSITILGAMLCEKNVRVCPLFTVGQNAYRLTDSLPTCCLIQSLFNLTCHLMYGSLCNNESSLVFSRNFFLIYPAV